VKIPKIKWIPFDSNNPPANLNPDETFLIFLREDDYNNGASWHYSVDVASPYGDYLDNFWTTENDWLEGQRVEVLAYARFPYYQKETEFDSQQLQNGLMGLNGESGECIDILKKHLFQGHDLDKYHIAKELGDVAWYLAVSAQALGFDLETILQMNVEKLKVRYPHGFDAGHSQHRSSGDI
jgi:NTP pyrophosphatase (non-canonical NTP hydrolase)